MSWWYSNQACRAVATFIHAATNGALCYFTLYVIGSLFGPWAEAACLLPTAYMIGWQGAAWMLRPQPPRPGDDLIGV